MEDPYAMTCTYRMRAHDLVHSASLLGWTYCTNEKVKKRGKTKNVAINKKNKGNKIYSEYSCIY